MSLTLSQLTDDAASLARTWMAATAAGQTAAERRTTHRLAQLVADPAGLEFAVRFVDRVARPDDLRVAAHELAALRSVASAPGAFLNPVDRLLVTAGTLALAVPSRVVPSRTTNSNAASPAARLVAGCGRCLSHSHLSIEQSPITH